MEKRRNSKLAVALVLGILLLSVVLGSEKFQTLVRDRFGWGQSQQGETPIIKPGEKTGNYRVVFLTDTHLLADSLYDDGTAFQQMLDSDDGKITPYVAEVLEAFTEEIVADRPDAVVLSGDLTLNGEKASHEQLAWMLNHIQTQGIQVLVIPGNHDINNHAATAFWGDERTSVDPVTPQQFLEIYQGFGYHQALSRDEASLSYVYALGEKKWLLMLDTNIYEPTNTVYGELKPETYAWIETQLQQAQAQEIQVVTVGHHNLLPESRLYTWACTIESWQAVRDLFEKYQVPLYVSGHLHAARMKKNKAEPGVPDEVYGVYERVNSAFCIPPCQYAVLTWSKDGSWTNEVKQVDVEGWAARHGRTEEELLNFQEYSKNEFYRIISGQIAAKVKSGVPEDKAQQMGEAYAELLYHYGAGLSIDKSAFRRSDNYQMWEWLRPDHECVDEMKQILNDLN